MYRDMYEHKDMTVKPFNLEYSNASLASLEAMPFPLKAGGTSVCRKMIFFLLMAYSINASSSSIGM
jgi:hypothetical protein